MLVPAYAQDLPPLAPTPQITAAQPREPQIQEIKPVFVTQMLTQVLMVTQMITNTVVESREISAPTGNILKSTNARRSTEISWSEYKAARRFLYKKMRASESSFRRTGWWVDASFLTSSAHITGSPYRLELLGSSLSWGGIRKGIMFGFSFQYTAADDGTQQRLPSLYEGSVVLGYRMAPDKGIGFRLMFHTGFGTTFGNEVLAASFSTPLKYVLLMPEVKLDVRIYKAFVLTFGVGYKGMIFLSDSKRFQNNLVNEFGFNTLQGLRYSLGLALSY